MKAERIAGLITPQIALGLAALLVGLYLVKRVADGTGKLADGVAGAAGAVVDSVNPASQTNIVQRIGTGLVQLDPQAKAQGLTLSTRIVDLFNFRGINDYDPNAPETAVGSYQLRR